MLRGIYSNAAWLFFLIRLFGAGVTAVFFLAVKSHIDFLADWAFLFHFGPSCCMLHSVQIG